MRPGSLTKSKMKCYSGGWQEEYGYSLARILIKKHSGVFSSKMTALQTIFFSYVLISLLRRKKQPWNRTLICIKVANKGLTMAWFNVQRKLQSRLVSVIRHWESLLTGALPFLHQERERAVETNSWSKMLSHAAKYGLPGLKQCDLKKPWTI